MFRRTRIEVARSIAGVLLAALATLDGCGGGGQPAPPSLQSINITPAQPSVAAGRSQAFKATGTFSDNTTQDVTADVIWSSSATAVATIDNSGLATGVGAGQATIAANCTIASACGSQSGAATLTVTAAALVSIHVTPGAPNIAGGLAQQFQATGTFTDQSTQDLTAGVSWVSSSTAVATISPGGLSAAVAPGNTSITATMSGVSGITTLSVAAPTWPIATYEAESGQLSGAAAIVGAADESDRAVGDLGGEASQRQAVILTNTGDSVAWVVRPTEAGANALVVRFSIPDAPGGGGASGSLILTILDGAGNTRLQRSLQLNSRYSWLYGGVMDGTRLYNVPANAAAHATASTPTHLYDEIQLKLDISAQSGDTIELTKGTASGVATLAVDFIELETVASPLTAATGFVSITDPRCGAIALDLRQTSSVFDGMDDSSYGSVFNSVPGNNPHNPSSFAVAEKDYYSTAAVDALQDTGTSALSAGLSMFDLADHNFRSLQTCLNLVTAGGSGLAGIYIPPGRFYVRGLLLLPGNIAIQGAGMWYSKLAAVDTAPPASVTSQGNTGIAGVSGNLVISSQPGGADKVALANFAMFGNVTQRDVVDSVIPDGIRAELTHSTIDNIWVEHTFSGIKTFQSSSAVRITNSRVRNTFADGIDFYGSTSNSSIADSTARSTGDDGFAMWSQGTTLAATSQSNTITNSAARLQWYGNGFAIYGGASMSITQSSGADILNFPCLQISTQFVSPALPAAATMSASASNLSFYRCGGNGFNQQFGALLIGTALESMNGIAVDGINIASPTYKGIDIRTLSPSHSIVATLNQVTIQNTELLGAPACAAIGSYTAGSAQLNNVCSCASVTSTPAACTVSTAASSTLQVTSNSCSTKMCQSF